jgi:hypothetical protein
MRNRPAVITGLVDAFSYLLLGRALARLADVD